MTLILAYHSISSGPPPLCVSPNLFREHLDVIADATALTFGDLARALREGTEPERAVALTFDDGYRDFVQHAAPLLAERGMPATVFCIAGWLGRTADWPTLPASAPRLPLADARELADVAAAGIEIGAHGVDHAPLHREERDVVERELVDGRRMLEEQVGVPVRTLAFPYGEPPPREADALVRREYDAACVGGLRHATARDDVYALPRVDAHYVRRPALLRAVLADRDAYLSARRAGARVRRLFTQDYAA